MADEYIDRSGTCTINASDLADCLNESDAEMKDLAVTTVLLAIGLPRVYVNSLQRTERELIYKSTPTPVFPNDGPDMGGYPVRVTLLTWPGDTPGQWVRAHITLAVVFSETVQANVTALGKTLFLLEQTDARSWAVVENMQCYEIPFVEESDDFDAADAFASATIVNHKGKFIRTGEVTTCLATVTPDEIRNDLYDSADP
jgi:hypothetical protein